MKSLLAIFAILVSVAAHANSFYYPVHSGDTVYTNDGYTATVNGVFGNGNISIRIGSSNYNYTRENLAVRACGQFACNSDTAYTRDGYTVTVNGVFPNGDLSVKIGSSNYKYVADNIASKLCNWNVCAGDQAVTNDGYSVTVNGIFPDGDVSVRIGSSNYTYDAANVASSTKRPSYPSHDPFRMPSPGEAAFTNDGYSATLSGVFADGSVSVKIGSSNYKYSRENIALTGCYGVFCSNDQAVTDDGYNVTVNGFFMNGDLSVRIGSSNYRYSYNRVARK